MFLLPRWALRSIAGGLFQSDRLCDTPVYLYFSNTNIDCTRKQQFLISSTAARTETFGSPNYYKRGENRKNWKRHYFHWRKTVCFTTSASVSLLPCYEANGLPPLPNASFTSIPISSSWPLLRGSSSFVSLLSLSCGVGVGRILGEETIRSWYSNMSRKT